MMIVTRASEKLGICKEPFSKRLEEALRLYNLPVKCEFPAEQLAEAALSDKKRMGGTLTLVVPERLGKCVLQAMPVSGLSAFFEAGLKD
jgi:3-dehydroquinate synthase